MWSRCVQPWAQSQHISTLQLSCRVMMQRLLVCRVSTSLPVLSPKCRLMRILQHQQVCMLATSKSSSSYCKLSMHMKASMWQVPLWCQGPLAYVEWYANLPASADPIHMMYKVCKLLLCVDGMPAGEIISLSMIRQSCQLIPHFLEPTRRSTISTIPSDWTSDFMLDKVQTFVLNNWATQYVYQTLW